MSDAMVLNFHDAVLYQSDLEILKSKAWLNDACIHFFFTRISSNLPSPSNCRFIDPSVLSFFMHQWNEEDEYEGEEDVLGMRQTKGNLLKEVAFFLPINDNYVSMRWTDPGGGTHWSLLLLVLSYSDSHMPISSQFWHFDSAAGCNQIGAQAVAQNIQRLLVRWHQNDNDAVMDQDQAIPYHECSVPQQQNRYDCGIHALATARVLATAMANAGRCSYQTEELEDMVQRSIPRSPVSCSMFCSQMRREIANDVEDLRKTSS